MGATYVNGFTVPHGHHGRSRRPSGLFDEHPISTKESATSVMIKGAANALKDDLDATDLSAGGDGGENGYKTYNARYLHLLVKSSDSETATIAIYSYNYNFGEWAPLMTSDGDGTFTALALSSGSRGQVKQYIVDISGADRLAFVKTSGTTASITCRVAMNTF